MNAEIQALTSQLARSIQHSVVVHDPGFRLLAHAIFEDRIDPVSQHSSWPADGPFASAAMGGGPGGFEAFLDHFAQGLQLLWLHSRLRPVVLWPWKRAGLVTQVNDGLEGRTVADLEVERDRKLRAVLETLGR